MRIFIALGTFWLAGWLITPFATGIAAWYFARNFAMNHPNLALIHQPLPTEETVSKFKETVTSPAGYKIHIPWGEIHPQNDFKGGTIVSFDGHKGLVVFDSPDTNDILNIWRSEDSKGIQNMRKVLGDNAVISNYAVISAEMNATPHDLRFFQSPHKIASASTLLMMKSMDTTNAFAIYPIAFGMWHGFQTNQKLKDRLIVRLLLFDSTNHRLNLTLTSPLGSTAVTQPEVNGIVAAVESPDQGYVSHKLRLVYRGAYASVGQSETHPILPEVQHLPLEYTIQPHMEVHKNYGIFCV